MGFPSDCQKKSPLWLSREELLRREHNEAIQGLEKKLRSKQLVGQNLTRHQAVLAFLRVQASRQLGGTREDMSFQVARCFGKGVYFA